MSFVDSVEKTHEQVIAEEGISKGSLPEAIQKKPKDSETTNTPKPFGNLVMEKKIRDIVNKNGNSRISQRELEAIIGKEPNYPEQKVHSITLRKVFLASDYRLL
jgi:hypothetical protein